MPKLTRNDIYLLSSMELLKEAGLTAYSVYVCSQDSEYPLSYPTVKRLFNTCTLPTQYRTYMGLLTVMYKMRQQLKNGIASKDVKRKVLAEVKREALERARDYTIGRTEDV